MAWWLFRKQGSKNWHVGWRDEEGTLRTRTTRTADKQIAKQRAVQYERERYAAEADLPAYALQDALNELIAHKRRSKRSAATLEITECKVGHLLRVLGEQRDVSTWTLADSNAYIDKRRGEGAHDHTIARELGQLKQALRIAHRMTPPRFDRDPSTIWPKEVLENAYEPCDTYWTLEQYETAQAHGIESRLDHVAMYCHTGMRFSELYLIEAQHVDLAGRRLFVGGKKTKGARRWVPLDDVAFEVASRRAAEHPVGPLFPDRWSRSRLVQDMKRVARRAGVPAASANDFRRTFCTWCAEAGVDEGTCVKWMGHTNSTMIRRVYRQLSERLSTMQGAKLSAFVRGADTARYLHQEAGSSAGSKHPAKQVVLVPPHAENLQ